MGIKQFTFCDTCRKEVEGGTPPATGCRATYREQGGETTESLLCDECFLLLVDTHSQMAGGKKPDVGKIPVLERALGLAAKEHAMSGSLIRNLQKRVEEQTAALGRLQGQLDAAESAIGTLRTQRANLEMEVERLDGKLKKRRR